MGKVTVVLVIVIVLLASLGGMACSWPLGTSPAPPTPVEKVMPDARFPK